MTSHAVLIGDGPLGERLVRAFAASETAALLVSDEDGVVESARDAGIEAIRADPFEATTFDRPELVGVESAVVATPTDSRSLLLAQRLRIGGSGRVVALVNDPQNIDAFADAGVETVCATSALADALARRHGEESPAVRTGDRPEGNRPDDVRTTGRADEESNDRGRSDDDRADRERLQSDGGRSRGR